MLDNLTPRERKLVYATGAVVPISLVFMVLFWFINSYKLNDEELDNLTKLIASETEKATSRESANRRRIYYGSIALPSNFDVANNNYGSWLKLLLEKEGMKISTFKPMDGGSLRVSARDPEIGRKKTFQVEAKSDLKELNNFLKEFYSVELLHRISSMKIIPLTEGTGKKKIRTGELKLIMKFETLSLNDAEARTEFTNSKRELAREASEYDALLRRNIFGPANNPPSIRVSKTINAYTGETANVRFTGRDVDDQDELSFELLESDMEGVELDATSSSARMAIKSEKEGEFKFKVRVADNGYPPKEAFAETTVIFKNRPPKPVAKKEDPPPKFKYLPHTRVTQISRERTGEWVAYVKVRPLKKNYRVKVGDDFELDDLTWKVTAIIADEVTFRAGDKTYVARPNPSDQGKLVEVSTRKSEESTPEKSDKADF